MFLALFVATLWTLIVTPFILLRRKPNKLKRIKKHWLLSFVSCGVVYVVSVIINGVYLYQTV